MLKKWSSSENSNRQKSAIFATVKHLFMSSSSKKSSIAWPCNQWQSSAALWKKTCWQESAENTLSIFASRHRLLHRASVACGWFTHTALQRRWCARRRSTVIAVSPTTMCTLDKNQSALIVSWASLLSTWSLSYSYSSWLEQLSWLMDTSRYNTLKKIPKKQRLLGSG